ncbi:hypothetical protein IWQ61_005779 [Dispira simplex]|nr:hypothetical protein IWQ61_005779 [Dispira simplex]
MESERSVVYGLRYQARCLTAVTASKDTTQFLVGTVGLQHDNELHLLTLDSEETYLSSVVCRHPSEIWDIASCPFDERLLFTVSKTSTSASSTQAVLWSLDLPQDQEESSGDDEQVLEPQLTLNDETLDGTLSRVLWNPRPNHHEILTLGKHSVQLWSLDAERFTGNCLANINGRDHGGIYFTAASWNIQQPQFATAGQSGVQCWDPRLLTKPEIRIAECHEGEVRCMEFNPNRAYQLATGGDDCKVRLWDLRAPHRPLMSLADHTHWVWSLAYNKFHDQLLLTSSSDCLVNLQSIVSVSSASLVTTGASDTEQDPHDDDSSDSDLHPDIGGFE